ncbi:WD_REPEATS_REGION domain-containing protein [Mortierella sp. 14UC]|nr:WD_REPEATS_REGION domain-containing protein [Mortierella sp. 14UC]
MLILGDSGGGKSTFNRYLEYVLWQRYTYGERIPLFSNLPALERPEKNLVAEQLRTLDISEDQMRELKRHRQLVLICDGYDESQLMTNLHTTNAFNQTGQWKVKLLVTCRTQYLGPDYRDRFVPKVTDQYYHVASDLFQEAVIAPFSKAQIELYVEKYVPLEPRTWVKADYMEKLTIIPNLMGLVKNPFLLTLALEALPMVVEGKTDLSTLRLTRIALYDIFVEHWLGVNKRRLQEHRLRDVKLDALEILLADGFERNGILFQKELALAIFREQEGRPIVDYSHKRDWMTWKAQFFGLDPDRSLLRDSSLLSRVGNQYRFVHRSILKYFFSCTIWDTTRHAVEFAPEAFLDATGNYLSIRDHPLSQRNLVPEPSIIQFLAERVQALPCFKQQLHGYIELSKLDPQASQAAANAITILIRAGVRFNGADMRGIRIPGADLTAEQFDSAQLQDSDLTGVNLTKTWLREADFSRAKMGGSLFGELPCLKETSRILSCTFSPDGTAFATGNLDGDISIYDTGIWIRTRSPCCHEGGVSSLVFLPSGRHLLSGGSDGSVKVWNCETGLVDCLLEGHTDEVEAVAYSPSSNQVASASLDNSVRLWDMRTGATVHVLISHTNRVTDIAYSPCGNRIASCSWDKTDAALLVTGDVGGGLTLWEAATLKVKAKWKAHSGSITCVDLSPDGQLIVSSSGDNMVKTRLELVLTQMALQAHGPAWHIPQMEGVLSLKVVLDWCNNTTQRLARSV